MFHRYTCACRSIARACSLLPKYTGPHVFANHDQLAVQPRRQANNDLVGGSRVRSRLTPPPAAASNHAKKPLYALITTPLEAWEGFYTSVHTYMHVLKSG